MANETLTQIGPNPGTFVPPIQGTMSMKDQNGVAIGVFVSFDNGGANRLTFDQWGPSSAVVDSLETSGDFDGEPTHWQMAFHGVGNITGHGNDDSYSGTIESDLSYSIGPHNRLECVFKNGSASITYTD